MEQLLEKLERYYDVKHHKMSLVLVKLYLTEWNKEKNNLERIGLYIEMEAFYLP